MSNELIIETRSVWPSDPHLIYNLPNGRKVSIGRHDVDFFEQLQKLPAATKIQMMQLTTEEMKAYIDQKYDSANVYLNELLKKKWYWRSEGIKANILPESFEDVCGLCLSQKQLLWKCKTKKLELEQINKLIRFFVGEGSEFYLP